MTAANPEKTTTLEAIASLSDAAARIGRYKLVAQPPTVCAARRAALHQASELTKIAPVTLRTQAEKGKLWAIRLDGGWVTTRERLQQYLDSRARRVKSTS